jgi:hypothetical protein
MGLGMLRIALDVAQHHDLLSAQLSIRNNLASFLAVRNLADARRHAQAGLALAERLGERSHASYLRATYAHICWHAGDWDELSDDEDIAGLAAFQGTLLYVNAVQLFRGESVHHVGGQEIGPDPQWQAVDEARQGVAAWAGGDPVGAQAALLRAVEAMHPLSEFDDDFPAIWALMMEAGCELGGTPAAESWLTQVAEAPRGMIPIVLRALLPYFRARMGQGGSQTAIESDFVEAAAALRTFGAPLWLGLTLLRHAEYLISVGQGESATGQLDEAEQIFTTLRATPWIEKARHARAFAIR